VQPRPRLRSPALAGLALASALITACSSTAAAPAGNSSPPAAATTGEAAPSSAPATPAPTSAAPSPAPPPAPAEISLAFAGDVHFAGRLEGRLATDPATAVGPISDTLRAADLAMVNLETAVTERGEPQPKTYTFRTPASAFAALRAAGVDVASLANNHAVDFGLVGLRDSLDAARAARFPVVGLGLNDAQAYAPYRVSLAGRRVAVLAATQVVDRTTSAWSAGPTSPGVASALDVERLVRAVRAERAATPAPGLVVVYLHWGRERGECPTERQRELAAALSSAGADVIVGTHAHQLQGAGLLGRTFVAYGLGNFVWYSSNSVTADTTGVLTLRVGFAGRQPTFRSTFTPARIDSRGVPVPREGADAARDRALFDQLRGCTGLAAAPSG